MEKILKIDKESIWVSTNDNQVVKYPLSAYNGKKPRIGELVKVFKGQNGNDFIQPSDDNNLKRDNKELFGKIFFILLYFIFFIFAVKCCHFFINASREISSNSDVDKNVKTNLSEIGNKNENSNKDDIKNEKEEKKRKRLFKPDLEVIDSGFCLIDYSVRGVCGRVKNNSSFNKSYVQVEINLYDRNGDLLDSTMDNINNLESGQTWSFKAMILDNRVLSYKIMDVSGF